MFFFYFESVLIRGKDAKQRAIKLLTNLDGTSLQLFYESLTAGGVMNDSGRDFAHVKKVILETFNKKKEPQNIIREVTEADLDPQGLVSSVHRSESAYNQAGLN